VKQYRSIGQIVILACALILFAIVVHRFLVPVVLGLIISMVYRPAFLWTTNKIKLKHLSAVISTIVILICVLLPLVLLGMFVYKDATSLVKTLLEVTEAKDHEAGIFSVPMLTNVYKGVTKIHPMTTAEFAESARDVISRLADAGKIFLTHMAASTPRKVMAVVFFLISFYFGLIDGPRFVAFLRKNLPFPSADIRTLFSHVQKICTAVVLGTFIAGLVQGTIIGLAYWIFGIPRPAVFGALTAIFSFVPLVGCAPTSIGGIVYLLTQGRIGPAIGMTVAFVLAGTSDNIVKPWVLKGKTELHPLLGLLSVLGGLMAFGPSGVFFGPIITVLVIVLLQIVPHRIKEAHPSEEHMPNVKQSS
jgi:predicted PurR-regulated permease PerM